MNVSSHKKFTYDKITVFFKHTDYNGFVHPYNYYEWMSYAREAYFQCLVPNFLELTKQNIKMVTSEVNLELKENLVFGDQIIVEIWAENLKKIRFDVMFEFISKKSASIVARGRQRLTFIDVERNRPGRIPEDLRSRVVDYEKCSNQDAK